MLLSFFREKTSAGRMQGFIKDLRNHWMEVHATYTRWVGQLLDHTIKEGGRKAETTESKGSICDVQTATAAAPDDQHCSLQTRCSDNILAFIIVLIAEMLLHNKPSVVGCQSLANNRPLVLLGRLSLVTVSPEDQQRTHKGATTFQLVCDHVTLLISSV